MHSYKVVLVGDCAVGKSNLHHQLLHREFSPGYVATIGVDYAVKSLALGGETIMMNVWDTAGQERFHAMTTNIYMRRANGVIFVYDMTRRSTFENIMRWIRLVETNGNITTENLVYMLVGNKADLDSKREVTHQEALNFAERYSMLFMETSAKTGLNVDQMYRVFGAEVHYKMYEKPQKHIVYTLDNGLGLNYSKTTSSEYHADGKPVCC